MRRFWLGLFVAGGATWTLIAASTGGDTTWFLAGAWDVTALWGLLLEVGRG